MAFIDNLIEKYNLAADSYYEDNVNPYVQVSAEDRQYAYKRTDELQEKYKSYIPKGWYGFLGLGSPMPSVWFDVIDEYIQWALMTCPELKIYQVKIKFGEVRLYLDNWTDEVRVASYKLTDMLYDKKLIY